MQKVCSAGGDSWKQQGICHSLVIRSELKHIIALTSFTLSYLDSLQEFSRQKTEQKQSALGLIEACAAIQVNESSGAVCTRSN